MKKLEVDIIQLGFWLCVDTADAIFVVRQMHEQCVNK